MVGRRSLELKTTPQLQSMQRAGVVLSSALDAAVAAAAPGVTTAEVDAVFADVLAEHGATSNFLGYHGFPASICASVNDEVVHGIPGDRVLQQGDVLKIDGGAVVDGWHSDSARTVILGSSDAGTADREDERLSEITRAALWVGVAAFASATGSVVGAVPEAGASVSASLVTSPFAFVSSVSAAMRPGIIPESPDGRTRVIAPGPHYGGRF